MKISRNGKVCNVVAIFMAMLYAFSTRSFLASVLFRTNIQVCLYYGITYFCLGVAFLHCFSKGNGHLYAPRSVFNVLTIVVVMLYSMYYAGNLKSMIYYGIAVLLPFAFLPEMKFSDKAGKILAFTGVFFAFGCFVNFLFPRLFQAVIFPLFTESAKASLEEVKGLTGGKTYYAGFTSQVGYTSFFISIAIGAVFCFRKTIFQKSFVILEIILIFGLLLTGKRGPFVFMIASLTFIFLLEGEGKEKFYRIARIGMSAILGFFVLMVVAKYTKIDSIRRIFETVQQLITVGTVEDAGRNQLYRQAIKYFMESPLFGIGWAHFKDKFFLRSTHVHCIYLQLLCETGILGFLVFIRFFALRLLDTIRKVTLSRSDGDTIESGWIELSLFIQVYFLLYGITGNPLYDAEETIIYFFAAGISYLPLLNGIRGIKR